MANKSVFIPELQSESAVRKLCGDSWRSLSGRDIDAAWGVAIVYAVASGVIPSPNALSSHFGVSKDNFQEAFMRLSMNGCFARGSVRIVSDKVHLLRGDLLTMGYYGGLAAGATGMVGD